MTYTRPRPGWPKTKKCLKCDRPMRARHPGEGCCRVCREVNAQLAAGDVPELEYAGALTALRRGAP